jgi:hypothetical protein
VVFAGPFSFGNQGMKLILQKKGQNRRPKNMYMDHVPGKNQMASMTIVAMKTRMVVLMERIKKLRKLASHIP